MSERVLADTLKRGDVIFPPEREMRLWMLRDAHARGLSESDLAMTIESVREAESDKRGRWLIVSARPSDAWCAGRPRSPFTFKVRPGTPWRALEIR